MTGGQLFAVVWCVVAVSLGFAFARYPKFMEEQYERQRRNSFFIGKLERTSGQRRWTVIFYRTSGIVFMVIGVCVGLAAALGALK